MCIRIFAQLWNGIFPLPDLQLFIWLLSESFHVDKNIHINERSVPYWSEPYHRVQFHLKQKKKSPAQLNLMLQQTLKKNKNNIDFFQLGASAGAWRESILLKE